MPLESVKPGFESWLSDLLDYLQLPTSLLWSAVSLSAKTLKWTLHLFGPILLYLKTHYASDIVLDAEALSYSDKCHKEKELKTEWCETEYLVGDLRRGHLGFKTKGTGSTNALTLQSLDSNEWERGSGTCGLEQRFWILSELGKPVESLKKGREIRQYIVLLMYFCGCCMKYALLREGEVFMA